MRRETVYVPARSKDFDMDSEGSSPAHSSEGAGPMELDMQAVADRMITASTTDTEQSSEVRPPATRKEKAFHYAKIILPHVGLVLLLVVYLLIGATIFHYIEAPNEMLTKERELGEIFGLRDAFHERVWELTHSPDTVIGREALAGVGQDYFEQLARLIWVAYQHQFINERHLLNRTRPDDKMLWTYQNSIFFSTTVVTTIGYGNLVPITTSGRVACIIFGLFGIPLLLVTIADIGKFLSDFLKFLYGNYRAFKKKVRTQSRKVSRLRSIAHSSRSRSQQSDEGGTSPSVPAGSMNLNELEEDEEEMEQSTGDQLKIPVVMVLFVLVAYTAIGGLLFQKIEGMPYFDAFYFCFITMATVGFGDIVPTGQAYVFITMAYIIFGLSLATMCIDLAGTEYIRRIHYIGMKMGDAKGVVITAGSGLKHTGIEVFRTAGGKLVQVRGAVLSSKQAKKLGIEYLLGECQKNILYEPLSPNVQKLVREKNIKILPDEIGEKDGYILQNQSYDLPTNTRYWLLTANPNVIHSYLAPPRRRSTAVLVPFVLKESDI